MFFCCWLHTSPSQPRFYLFFFFFCWFGLFFDYWKLHGARRTLGNVALILMRVLLLLWPHRSIDLECYQLFACLLFCVCLWVRSVHVWRLFGLVGSIIRICCLPFCLFWCYYSIIIISFNYYYFILFAMLDFVIVCVCVCCVCVRVFLGCFLLSSSCFLYCFLYNNILFFL